MYNSSRSQSVLHCYGSTPQKSSWLLATTAIGSLLCHETLLATGRLQDKGTWRREGFLKRQANRQVQSMEQIGCVIPIFLQVGCHHKAINPTTSLAGKHPLQTINQETGRRGDPTTEMQTLKLK